MNRLPTTIQVYHENKGEHIPIEWKVLDNDFKKNKLKQMDLNVALSKENKLKARMVIIPVSDNVYQKRIKGASKHARSKGCQLTDEYRIKARYNIFITNISSDRFSAQEVLKVYRLRWQVELVFKTWKSSLSVDKTKKVKKERFECQLIAKIIWALINWRIYQFIDLAIKKAEPDKGISILKFFKQSKKYISIPRQIIEHPDLLKKMINKQIIPITSNLLIEKKKGKPSHCQVLKKVVYRLS